MNFRTTSLATVLLCATLAAPSAAVAAGSLTPAQQFKLRCATAFAFVAAAQERNDPRGASYPPMEERGREYFLRAVHGAMESAGMTEEETRAALTAEAKALAEPEALGKTMPLCLKSLEASGL